MPDIVSLGECMVELFADEPLARASHFSKSFGGDTLNLLVAARRLGSSVGYITRVGDDAFGPYLLASWQQEGVDVSQVRPGKGPNGLYFISLLPEGQREFIYYRTGSVASTLGPEDIAPDYLATAKVVHLSGITQALSTTARQAVLVAAQVAHQKGVRVSYDPNLRLRLWSLEEARAALEEVLPYVSIALPSAPQEIEGLLGVHTAEEAIQWLWRRGVELVVVKTGPSGCVVGVGGEIMSLPAYDAGPVVDSTGAGDAFNGAFLHGVMTGMDPLEAARLGNIMAGLKVRGRGAICSLPTREEVYAAFSQTRG